jgi:nucleotide-binding universal stress UspA family protein
MFKTILVPSGGAVTDTPVYETALAIARISGAHLVFLHVRTDIRDVIASMAAGDLGGGSVTGGMVDDMEADAGNVEAAAKSFVEAFCAREQIPMSGAPLASHGVTAEWQTQIGRLSDCVASLARTTDLTVVGRSPSNAGVGAEVLEAGMMTTGRPVLIASSAGPGALGKTVVIAWRDTQEAGRAVAAAIPFIESAERVIIVSVNASAGEMDEACERLRKMLSWHNPNVTTTILAPQKDSASDIVLAEAVKLGAGLLVMGGYGHNPLREAIFGGFTQHVVSSADIPVLMIH